MEVSHAGSLTLATAIDPIFQSENLAAGTGSSYDIAAAINSWAVEVCE